MSASALTQALPKVDFDTYLDIEAIASNKHEFYHGVVYAMAGSPNIHLILCSNALVQLSRLLARRNCYVFSEARVVSPNSAASFYADVSVHCDQVLPSNGLATKSPILVAEVLSPSTHKFDLNAKRKEYFRDANQTWPKDPKASIPLTALNINLKLRDLYRQSGLLTMKS